MLAAALPPLPPSLPLCAAQRRELNLMRNFAVSFGLLSMLTGLGGFYYYGFTCECMHLSMGACKGCQTCAAVCPARPPRSQALGVQVGHEQPLLPS
jgi:ferredoxin